MYRATLQNAPITRWMQRGVGINKKIAGDCALRTATRDKMAKTFASSNLYNIGTNIVHTEWFSVMDCFQRVARCLVRARSLRAPRTSLRFTCASETVARVATIDCYSSPT